MGVNTDGYENSDWAYFGIEINAADSGSEPTVGSAHARTIFIADIVRNSLSVPDFTSSPKFSYTGITYDE